MEILGYGLGGVVVADAPGTVKKFYLNEKDGHAEEEHLAYVNSLQRHGLDMKCTVPELLEVIGQGKWEIEGKAYVYCNRMERVPGTSARKLLPVFTKSATQRLGESLGTAAFAMHSFSKTHIEEWKRKYGSEDVELAHILNDKARAVLSEKYDAEVTRRVAAAARYLEKQCRTLTSDNVLSHLDFSMANAQADPDGHLYGIVDWGMYGLTDSSLSLYSMAYREVWPHVRDQYEQLGGAVREDIAYAAAAIHLAWAPIISKERNFPLDADETPDNFEAMWAQFEAYRHDL